MGQHPVVLEAAERALREYGAGAGGTRNISGTTHLHVLLEQELASLHRKEAALVMTSGYVANEAAISTIARLLPDCVIFSDSLNHASMIAGVRASSGCEKRIFRHNDLDHLESLLAALPRERAKLVIFESVYSMDGDLRPDPRGLRSGRALQRHDLSRRGARGRHVRLDAVRGSPSATGPSPGSTSSRARSPRPMAAWAATSPHRGR
jgi:hypothetical protein